MNDFAGSGKSMESRKKVHYYHLTVKNQSFIDIIYNREVVNTIFDIEN